MKLDTWLRKSLRKSRLTDLGTVKCRTREEEAGLQAAKLLPVCGESLVRGPGLWDVTVRRPDEGRGGQLPRGAAAGAEARAGVPAGGRATAGT